MIYDGSCGIARRWWLSGYMPPVRMASSPFVLPSFVCLRRRLKVVRRWSFGWRWDGVRCRYHESMIDETNIREISTSSMLDFSFIVVFSIQVENCRSSKVKVIS